MPNEPIIQPIRADYDGKPVEDAARDMQKLGEANEQAGKQAEQASTKVRTHEQRIRDMKQELDGLLRIQSRAEGSSRELTEADDRRQQRIERLSRALAIHKENQQRVNETIQSATRVQAEAVVEQEKSVTLTERLGAALTSMAGGLAGAGGAIAVMDLFRSNIEATNRALEEQARLAREAAQATLELHALSGGFSAEDEAFVNELRTETGRSKQDIAAAFTTFKSATAALNPQTQRDFFRTLATRPGEATNGSLLPLADLFAKASATESDPARLSNLIKVLQDQAGEGDPGKVAQYVTPLLEPGKVAGLSIEEIFGLFAFGTRSQGSSQASNQLRNLFLRFQGDEQTREALGAFGVSDAPFLEQIAAVARSRPDTGTLTKLAGIENTALLASLVNRPGEAFGAIAKLREAGSTDVDLFGEFQTALRENNPNFDLAKRQAQQEQRTLIEKEQGVRGQEAALARGVIEELLVAARERGDLTPLDVENKLKTFDTAIGAGFSPSFAARVAENALVSPDVTGIRQSFGRAFLGPLPTLNAARRSFFGTPDLSGAVSEELGGAASGGDASGGAVSGGGGGGTVINNFGTTIHHGKDPYTSDLGRPRP